MPPGTVEEKVYPTDIEPEVALKFLASIPTDWSASITKLILKDKINTYAYSKHIAERLVERAWNNLPVSIVRPGGITSAMTEPLPGWNETQSSSSKWAKLIFCGAYHTVLGNKQGRFELTPVDYAVNTCLAAAWRLGTATPKTFHVYNCVPNRKSNPIMLRDLINWGCETTRESLSVKKHENYYPLISNNTNIFDVNNYLFRKIPGQFWTLLKKGSYPNFQKDYNEAQLIAKTFKAVTTENWEFETSNMAELNQLMDPLDKALFPIDFDQIDWKLFIEYLACGLHKHSQN
ncbi:unnamed protein product [Allacma fusca]|uniref:Fatty acyl-CoA reductase n=1 Tax=Allacma fusca TaxID=39272 RepID=A0A8J2JDE4_9HEXA|nr:unnamed protein product [Allacma fusca]